MIEEHQDTRRERHSTMYDIALVNMPFATVTMPSIALTQLKARVQAECGGRAHCQVFYLNQDLARHLGVEVYTKVSDSVQAVTAGLGDWFFRGVAYPDLPDNRPEYFRRHFSEYADEIMEFEKTIENKREHLTSYLEALIDRYRLDQFDFVGMTSMFSQNVACISLARLLKSRRSDIVIAMGGANCESPMGEVLAKNVPWLDFVFSGPSLKTFPQLVANLMDGEEAACHQIMGVLSQRKLIQSDGQPRVELGSDLDIDVDIPLDYDDFLAAVGEQFPVPEFKIEIPFETSRGCWWGERSHCTFCGLNGATMRYRSMKPEKAVAMLQGLFQRYYPRATRFQSVDNILPREYLQEVLPRLSTPDGATIFYEVKADLKDHEMAVMADAGVTVIQPGIEALATSTLKLMGKGVTSFQNLRFLSSCLTYGIEPHWNLLVGFPGEEPDVYEKYHRDLPTLVHLPPPSGAFPIRFDRFSPYHRNPESFGIDLTASDFYGMIYPFEAEEIEALAYFFADRTRDAEYIAHTARWLRRLRRQVEYWKERWEGLDGGLKPRLYLLKEGDGGTVYDSRTGLEAEYSVSQLGVRLLEALDRHAKVERLAAAFSDVDPGQVVAEIERFAELALLFEERGMIQRLVSIPDVGDLSTRPMKRDLAEEFDFSTME